MTRKFSNIVTSIALIGALVISSIVSFPMTSKADEYIEEQTMQVYDAMNIDLTKIAVNSAYTVSTAAAKYDPRNYSPKRVTSVKNQGEEGMCWDYAIQAVAESSLIKSGQETNTIDLSEIYFAYDRYKKVKPSGTFYQYAYGGTSLVTQNLNNSEKFYAFAYESDFPMPLKKDDVGCDIPDTDKVKTYTLTDSQRENYKYIVSKSYIINSYESTAECINKVKQLISKFGGATYSYYSNDDYISNKSTDKTVDLSYYYPTKHDTSHAVEIVGWDDNYAASNFKETPPGNGAWLIKNSWGTGAQKQEQVGNYLYTYKSSLGSGYMWISYYNDSIGDEVCAMELVPKGVATFETKSITYEADETIDLTKFNSDATNWTYEYLKYPVQKVKDTNFTPTAFGVCTFKGYDDWGNLLGEYEVNVIPSSDAKLTINIDDIHEKTNWINSIQGIWLYDKVTIDGIKVEPTYTSSNENVASVNTSDYLQFKDYGTTTITAEIDINGTTYTDSFNITIEPDGIENITASTTWYYIKVGESDKIEGVITYPWNDEIIYTSDNPNIATVDENGYIKGVSIGETKIYVRPKTNSTLSAEIEVGVWNDKTDVITSEDFIPYTPEPTPINTTPVTIVTPGNTNTPISETSNVISGKELAKMIRKPSLKAEGKKKSIKLKIGDTGASYYEVKVSTSKKFTKKSTKVLKAYDTTYTVKKLKKNTTYYVKVRGVVYGEKGKWSKIKEVKTKK